MSEARSQKKKMSEARIVKDYTCSILLILTSLFLQKKKDPNIPISEPTLDGKQLQLMTKVHQHKSTSKTIQPY